MIAINQGWAPGLPETPSGLDFILLTELFSQPLYFDTNFPYPDVVIE